MRGQTQTADIHTHTHTQRRRQTVSEREAKTLPASVANKEKTLDATLFNSQYASDGDQRYLNNYKNYPRAPSANKIPPLCLVW